VPEIGTIRVTFFLNQMQAKPQVTASEYADFCMANSRLKLEEKQKKKANVLIDHAFGVKMISIGFGNTVPLWAVGMNY
jgi:hypothetical protein